MRRLVRILAVVLGLALVAGPVGGERAPARKSSLCTVIVDHAAALASSLRLQPGDVLCLRDGTYRVDELQLAASGTDSARITLRSYPGQQAVLVSTTGGVVRVLGSYWTLTNLILDNNGLMQAAVSVTPSGDHFELLNSEVRNGTYYGVDIWGPNARVEGDRIHYFWPGSVDTSAGGERHCINVHNSASNLVVRGNTIFDCWGDGLQMYDSYASSDLAHYAHNVLIENNNFLRGDQLDYGSNAIDIKGVVSGTVCSNDISGYVLPQVSIAHLDQAAIIIHHGVQGLTIAGNHIHDGYEGMQLNATADGQLAEVVVRNNDLRDLSGFGLDLEGLYAGSVIEQNSLTNIAGDAIQIAGEGIQDSRFGQNLIVNSGPSQVYAGASLSGTAFGPNAWYGSDHSGILSTEDDVIGSGHPSSVLGFGVFLGANRRGRWHEADVTSPC